MLLSSMLLLQSCYSYKTSNKEDLKIDKTYKVLLNKEILKIKVQKITDSTMVAVHKNQEKSININELENIQIRKF